MQKKINIGITFFWGDSYQHIWSNGAGQNMFFLKLCLEQIEFVNEVYFVYWGNELTSFPSQFQGFNVKYYEYHEVLNKTDLLIEGTLALEPAIGRAFRAQGPESYRIAWAMILSWIWKNSFMPNRAGVLLTEHGMMPFGSPRI